MPNAKVTAELYEAFVTDEDDDTYTEFVFQVPTEIYESKGQTGAYGQKLEPDERGVDIIGDITVIADGDEEMTTDVFLERHGKKAEDALDSVYNDRERLYEAAADKASQHERDAALERADI